MQITKGQSKKNITVARSIDKLKQHRNGLRARGELNTTQVDRFISELSNSKDDFLVDTYERSQRYKGLTKAGLSASEALHKLTGHSLIGLTVPAVAFGGPLAGGIVLAIASSLHAGVGRMRTKLADKYLFAKEAEKLNQMVAAPLDVETSPRAKYSKKDLVRTLDEMVEQVPLQQQSITRKHRSQLTNLSQGNAAVLSAQHPTALSAINQAVEHLEGNSPKVGERSQADLSINDSIKMLEGLEHKKLLEFDKRGAAQTRSFIEKLQSSDAENLLEVYEEVAKREALAPLKAGLLTAAPVLPMVAQVLRWTSFTTFAPAGMLAVLGVGMLAGGWAGKSSPQIKALVSPRFGTHSLEETERSMNRLKKTDWNLSSPNHRLHRLGSQKTKGDLLAAYDQRIQSAPFKNQEALREARAEVAKLPSGLASDLAKKYPEKVVDIDRALLYLSEPSSDEKFTSLADMPVGKAVQLLDALRNEQILGQRSAESTKALKKTLTSSKGGNLLEARQRLESGWFVRNRSERLAEIDQVELALQKMLEAEPHPFNGVEREKVFAFIEEKMVGGTLEEQSFYRESRNRLEKVKGDSGYEMFSHALNTKRAEEADMLARVFQDIKPSWGSGKGSEND